MSKKSDSKATGRKRRRKASSEQIDSLYMKRQQLLREMQEKGDTSGVSIREQLKALEEAAKEAAPNEDDWGKRSSRRKNGMWMLLLIVGIMIPVLIMGIMVLVRKTISPTDRATGEDTFTFDELVVANEVDPQEWFVENSGKLFEDGVEILEKLSGESLEQSAVAGLVRSPEQAEKVLNWKKEGKWAAFDLREPIELDFGYETSKDFAFMIITGPRADYRDFRAYFVRSGEDSVQLDVDATEGWSEKAIPTLPAKSLGSPVLVRAWVAKEPHFDARSDEEKYSWYQILTPNLVDFVWAYCEMNGELDKALKTELNYGRFLEDRKREFRATIRLGDSEVQEFKDDEFKLTEFITPEWVLPPS